MTHTTSLPHRSGFGLGQQLALFVGLALSVGIGAVVSIGAMREIALLRSAFYAGAERTTELVSQTLGGAVRFGKVENIAPTLAYLAQTQPNDIAWIAVVDAAGAVITATPLLSAVEPDAAAEAMAQATASGAPVRLRHVTATPVRFGPQDAIVGGLIVGWSDAHAMAKARSDAWALALIGGGLTVVFSALAYLGLSQLVTAPIARMNASLQGLAAGRFDVAVPGQNRRDEIGPMARNLERLRGALAEAEAQRARLGEIERGALLERESMLAALRSGVGAVVAAAQQGDFSRRVEQNFDDATLQGLASGVNAICEVVSRFLDDGETAIRALSQGDLTRAMAKTYTGRFDGFARGLNATLDGLRTLVIQLQETQALIADSVADLSRDSDDLSGRAVAQATALQETSATMLELSATIRTNADNARSSAEAVGDARGQADVSRVLIGKAVAAMKDIQAGTQEITEIVDAIDGFAFQTNLLALNAAVEAARAGDAGKGFAVVASEVRTLAQRAAEAAKDIRRLITVSQANVDNGAAVVDATGAALSDILTSFVAIAPAMTQISHATREQATGVAELTATLSEIDDATRKNAHLAERGAGRAQALREQSQALSHLIAFFRQPDGGSLQIRAAE